METMCIERIYSGAAALCSEGHVMQFPFLGKIKKQIKEVKTPGHSTKPKHGSKGGASVARDYLDEGPAKAAETST